MSSLNGRITGKYIPSRWETFMETLENSPPPYKEFNAIMALNGWYWEEFGGTVAHVIIECRNLARIERPGCPTLYKTVPELRTWLGKMGYEKEGQDDD